MLFKISQVIKFNLSIARFLSVPDSWHLLTPCDFLLLAHNNDRALTINGKSYSQLIHSIRYYLEKKGFICSGISTAFDIKNYKHNYYEDKTINIMFLWNIIKAKFKSLVLRKNYSELKINGEVKLWDKILEKARPKVVIAIQPYDSLCIACHRLQIPIYDFQHGAITESGPNYGRELYLKKELNRIPTGYLCWDKESADMLNQWCTQRNIRVEVLGHPWLHRFNTIDDSDLLIKNISQGKPFTSDKKTILVTLQWGLDDIYPEFFDKGHIIHPVLLDIINKLNSDVMWLIRLHPVQMKSKQILQNIKRLFKHHHSVDIDWSSNQPLPVILSLCHGHITWDSYVVAEAAKCNIKSYVLNPGHFSPNTKTTNNSDIKLPYIQQELSGLAKRSPKFPNTEDIIAWVGELSTDHSQSPSSRQCLFDLDKLYRLAKPQD